MQKSASQLCGATSSHFDGAVLRHRKPRVLLIANGRDTALEKSKDSKPTAFPPIEGAYIRGPNRVDNRPRVTIEKTDGFVGLLFHGVVADDDPVGQNWKVAFKATLDINEIIAKAFDVRATIEPAEQAAIGAIDWICDLEPFAPDWYAARITERYGDLRFYREQAIRRQIEEFAPSIDKSTIRSIENLLDKLILVASTLGAECAVADLSARNKKNAESGSAMRRAGREGSRKREEKQAPINQRRLRAMKEYIRRGASVLNAARWTCARGLGPTPGANATLYYRDKRRSKVKLDPNET
ncbi:MAG: hypothetical protein AAF318_16810 [Pseudomonadota bacterium]